jgi:hypothetical protein
MVTNIRLSIAVSRVLDWGVGATHSDICCVGVAPDIKQNALCCPVSALSQHGHWYIYIYIYGYIFAIYALTTFDDIASSLEVHLGRSDLDNSTLRKSFVSVRMDVTNQVSQHTRRFHRVHI